MKVLANGYDLYVGGEQVRLFGEVLKNGGLPKVDKVRVEAPSGHLKDFRITAGELEKHYYYYIIIILLLYYCYLNILYYCYYIVIVLIY